MSITTTAMPVAPNPNEVEITVTLLNRTNFACALTKNACPHGDLYAEAVNAVGAVVWSPGYTVGCPPQSRLAADSVAAHTSFKVTETWDLSDCGPGYGCTSTNAAPGTYRARGIFDTVGISSDSAPFTVS